MKTPPALRSLSPHHTRSWLSYFKFNLVLIWKDAEGGPGTNMMAMFKLRYPEWMQHSQALHITKHWKISIVHFEHNFLFGTTNGSKFVTIYFICLFVSSLERTHTHTLRKLVGSEERLCGYMPYYLLTYRELRVCFGTKFKFRNCSGDDITHLCLVMALSLSLSHFKFYHLFVF